jgi:titin
LTRTTTGAASTTTLADSERPAAITPAGTCVAFKADRGYDLLAGNSGPAQGIFLWDNRTGTPVISLVSKDSSGNAATSASNPRISDDCRFVSFQTDDEFLSDYDNNNETDVYLYDTVAQSSDLISTDALGNSADGSSFVAALDWNPTTNEGVVLLISSASNIGGAAGGDATLDLFAVPFGARAIAPTSLVVTNGNTQASIEFTAPSSSGSATITNYEYSTNNGVTWKAFSPVDITTPVVITTVSTATTALVNGTTYSVKLRAVTSAGKGAASAVATVTPRTTAGAPTALVAKAGNAQAIISFTAPSSTGGAAITNYEYSTDNGVTFKALSPADATSPVAITTVSTGTTALVNLTAYSVKLRAVNLAGVGTTSAVTTATPKQTNAPTALVATAGVAQATIAFTAPSTGGLPFTNYEYSTDNGVTFKAFSPVDILSPVVITTLSDATTALVNGTTYSVKLRTVNAGGVGTASAAVSVTPRTSSSAPTSLVATAQDSQITVAFTAPSSDGGSAITNYGYSTNNGLTWKSLSPADATSPVTIAIRSDAATALVNGTLYKVLLRANNGAGAGASSTMVEVTPGVATAPTSLVATAGDRQTTIAFTAPSSNGGVAITNYEYSTNNGTTWKLLNPVDGTTPVTISIRSDATTALVNGTTYSVKLRAVSSAGKKGAISAAVSVTPAAVASAPSSLVATATVGQISVAFAAPSSTGGAAITNYEYSTNNGVTWKAFSTPDTTTPVVITIRSDATTALVNGATYKVMLRAVNSAGSGAASTFVSVVMPQ